MRYRERKLPYMLLLIAAIGSTVCMTLGIVISFAQSGGLVERRTVLLFFLRMIPVSVLVLMAVLMKKKANPMLDLIMYLVHTLVGFVISVAALMAEGLSDYVEKDILSRFSQIYGTSEGTLELSYQAMILLLPLIGIVIALASKKTGFLKVALVMTIICVSAKVAMLLLTGLEYTSNYLQNIGEDYAIYFLYNGVISFLYMPWPALLVKIALLNTAKNIVRVGGPVIIESAPQPVPAPRVQPVKTPPIQNVCLYCNSVLKEGASFCANCGAPVGGMATQGTASSATSEQDIELLKKLAELKDAGVISEEEWQEKRKAILERI